MTKDNWKIRWWRSPLDFVQLGVTYPAGEDLDEKFSITGARLRHINQLQGFFVLPQVANLF
jgi:hypothetical protein